MTRRPVWVLPLLLAQRELRAQPPRREVPLAITHVTVVDVAAGAPLRDRTVIVAGRRIVSVGPSAGAPVPRGARVVDGRGKYLIPGLWDAHSHALWPSGTDTMPYRRLMLAMGVTSTREPGSRVRLADIRALRRRIDAGELLAPRIAAASGPVLDGPLSDRSFVQVRRVDSRERARFLVDSLNAEGADFIKVHNGMTPEAVRWVADAARAAGLPVSGHLMPGGAATTFAAGIRAIDHVFPVAWCVTDAWAAERARAPVAVGEGRVLANLQANEANAAHEDPEKCAAVRRQLADSGVTIVSTAVQGLVWRAVMTRGAELADRLRYVTPQDRWRWEHDDAFGAVTPEIVALAERNLERTRLRHTLAAHRAGVRVIVGTDAVPFPYTVPGFAVHDELALLVRGGFTPAEALRAATLEPAAFLGMRDSLGTIAAGQLADLVLLDADPLADVRNAAHIAAVVAAGRLIDRAARARLLDEQRRLAAGPPRQPVDSLVGEFPPRR